MNQSDTPSNCRASDTTREQFHKQQYFIENAALGKVYIEQRINALKIIEECTNVM